jgi:hypothetical protein
MHSHRCSLVLAVICGMVAGITLSVIMGIAFMAAFYSVRNLRRRWPKPASELTFCYLHAGAQRRLRGQGRVHL